MLYPHIKIPTESTTLWCSLTVIVKSLCVETYALLHSVAVSRTRQILSHLGSTSPLTKPH